MNTLFATPESSARQRKIRKQGLPRILPSRYFKILIFPRTGSSNFSSRTTPSIAKMQAISISRPNTPHRILNTMPTAGIMVSMPKSTSPIMTVSRTTSD